MTSATLPSIDTFNLFPASPINHVIMFSRMPEVSFVVQDVRLPGLSANPARVVAPGLIVRHAPDRLNYDPLTVTFMIDEDYRAHRELHDWMIGMTGGEDRATLVANFLKDQEYWTWPETDPYKKHGRACSTHAGLTIVNGAKVPVVQVLFYNVYITQIGEVAFSTMATDTITAMTSTATFEYDYYRIVRSKC